MDTEFIKKSLIALFEYIEATHASVSRLKDVAKEMEDVEKGKSSPSDALWVAENHLEMCEKLNQIEKIDISKLVLTFYKL